MDFTSTSLTSLNKTPTVLDKSNDKKSDKSDDKKFETKKSRDTKKMKDRSVIYKKRKSLVGKNPFDNPTNDQNNPLPEKEDLNEVNANASQPFVPTIHPAAADTKRYLDSLGIQDHLNDSIEPKKETETIKANKNDSPKIYRKLADLEKASDKFSKKTKPKKSKSSSFDENKHRFLTALFKYITIKVAYSNFIIFIIRFVGSEKKLKEVFINQPQFELMIYICVWLVQIQLILIHILINCPFYLVSF